MWNSHLFLLLFFLVSLSRSAHAQQTPSTMIFRGHFESIASELADSVGFQEPLAVVIEGSQQKSLAENAFAEVFQRRGGRISFSGKDRTVLRVFVLSEKEEQNDLAAGKVLRTIQVTLEARSESPLSDLVRYWGRFERSSRDSVNRSDLPWREESATGVEKIVEPLVVIAGSALIVYLLFTVRN